MSPFLEADGPLAFAHRGGAAHHPENSWRAFEHAVSLGYRYLETDARATSDGVLLAFHDETLDRVTDRTGRVAELPYSSVAAALVAGQEPIPKLEDLLGTWPDARFNIDVKHPGSVGPLAGVLRRTAAWDRVCVCSFSSARLRAARRALGRPVCMAASPAAIGAVAAGLGGRAAGLASPGAQCAQIPARMATPAFLRRAHAIGWPVHAWTVNDPAQMTRLLDAGVDGLITDNTVALRQVLTARGSWPPA